MITLRKSKKNIYSDYTGLSGVDSILFLITHNARSRLNLRHAKQLDAPNDHARPTI